MYCILLLVLFMNQTPGQEEYPRAFSCVGLLDSMPLGSRQTASSQPTVAYVDQHNTAELYAAMNAY